MIEVCAPSRLHFGLLSLPAQGQESPARRHFGGVGLMVREPGLRLRADPAAGWSAAGPLAERALAFAERALEAVRGAGLAQPPSPQHFVIDRAAPQHAGLGTGTQLGLAVARVLTEACGQGQTPVAELAHWVGRGARSALGVHGFAKGGFLVEAGKTSTGALSPLVARLALPEDWRIVLIFPGGPAGLHGVEEVHAFQRLLSEPAAPARTEALCRLVLLGMLPALVERDLAVFGEALYEFNRLVGEAFAAVQGGTCSHPAGDTIVSFIRRQGIHGAGQSSWGPTLFAIAGDPERARNLGRRICKEFGLPGEGVLVTSAANEGARIRMTRAGASRP